MGGDYTKDGERLLEEIRPHSFLCIGAGCETLTRSPHAPAGSVCLTPETAPTALGALGAFDFAFVAGALEQLPKTSGRQLLARLRDLHGGRFAVTVELEKGPPGGGWSDGELLAMGLTRARREGPALYLFDIRTYKQTPDWLNPRFWANPERWDKHWW